jgi:FkbM family methyltransferase
MPRKKSNAPAFAEGDELQEQLSEVSRELRIARYQIEELEKLCRDIRSLVGPFGVPYPDGTVLVQTLYGTKYFLEIADMVMAPQMIVYRQWEMDLSNFFLAITNPDSVFIDVGANIGYFTCLVGTKIGRSGTGKVFAVEANPKVYDILTRNIDVNWGMCPITTFACGASDRNGTAVLHVPERAAANASLAQIPSDPGALKHTIELKTLDDLLGNEKVDFMKIDVEGFELTVLKGAIETIKQSPDLIIVMEWSLDQMLRANSTPQDLIAFASQNGMEFFDIPPAVHNLAMVDWPSLRLTENRLGTMSYGNVVLRHTAV